MRRAWVGEDGFSLGRSDFGGCAVVVVDDEGAMMGFG